ncbi:MAG: hypothetical protein R3F17_02250 [Planctomycetota bacterium]
MSAFELNLFDLQQGKRLLDRYTIDNALPHGPLSARFRVLEDGGRASELEVFTAGLFEGRGQAMFFCERLQAFADCEADFHVATRHLAVSERGDVLRFCDEASGTCLRTRLEEGRRLHRDEAIRLGVAMLRALMPLHSAGFCHGDIKPSTLYWDGEEVRATQGGVTPALWRAQHMGARTTLIGTPYYAPLEQFGGESPDSGSDVYATGTVLYEALCGALPWSGRGFIEVFQSKMKDNPPPIESRASNLNVGGDLEEIVRKAIRARREDRYVNAHAMLDALTALQ